MMNKRVFALGRLKSGQMNKTEAAYAQELEARKNAQELLWYAFEGVTLKLADGCRYTPDFSVLRAMELWRCMRLRATGLTMHGQRSKSQQISFLLSS